MKDDGLHLSLDFPVQRRWMLVGLLILASLMRLYQVNGPLVDQMYVKQVFAANKLLR